MGTSQEACWRFSPDPQNVGVCLRCGFTDDDHANVTKLKAELSIQAAVWNSLDYYINQICNSYYMNLASDDTLNHIRTKIQLVIDSLVANNSYNLEMRNLVVDYDTKERVSLYISVIYRVKQKADKEFRKPACVYQLKYPNMLSPMWTK